MNVLSVSNLFSFPLLGNFSLTDITFTQNQFENVAIIGETGSGKSTLLKTIAGFIQPSEGTILLNNKKVLGPDWQLVAGQKGIAYLSQHFELCNNYKMDELLAFNNQFTNEDAAKLYKICRIDHLMKRNSYQLSGGEKQRLALAILLVTKPSLLILDEPYSNLDVTNKNMLKKVIAEVCTLYKISSILASHEPNDILPWANKIIAIDKGKIVQEGNASAVYLRPANEYVAGLLGNYTCIDTSLAKLLNLNLPLNIFLRPHQIIITTISNGAFLGRVIGCNYMGSYYQIEIDFSNYKFYTTSSSQIIMGSQVYFNIIF